MKQLVFVLGGIVLLSGCDANGRAGSERSAIWNMRHFSAEAKIEYFTQKCAKYGYKPGTDAMRDCVAEEMRS